MEDKYVECPECLEKVTPEELEVFEGLCETCYEEKENSIDEEA